MSLPATIPLYGYPDVGRTGLGHSLLAWGRCAVWCRNTGATMLAPRWLRLRIGPYLRRERDKRNYALLFHKGPYVGEPRRSAIIATSNTLYAELDLPEPGFKPSRPTVVVFRNAMGANTPKFFHQIAEHGPFLREQLVAMTRPKFIPVQPTAPFIAAHVRLGDFSTATPEQLARGATNSRVPIAWYCNVIHQTRRKLGTSMPVVVFSDGLDEELAPLLAIEGIVRAPKQHSITDLLSISQARLLVASGSGFSHWGSFLGGVTRIHYPGQGIGRNVQVCEREFETDGHQELPDELLRAVVPASSTKFSPINTFPSDRKRGTHG